MPLPHRDLKRDVSLIVAWSICGPALACWPFLSAMPGFALLGGGLSMLDATVNAVLLLTGFWPLAAAYFAYLILRVRPMAAPERAPRTQRGLLLGAYALTWTGLYLIATIASR